MVQKPQSLAREAARAAVEDGDTVSGIRGMKVAFQKMYERMAPFSELLSDEREEKKAFVILEQRAKSHRFRNDHAVAYACAGSLLAVLVCGVSIFTSFAIVPYFRSRELTSGGKFVSTQTVYGRSEGERERGSGNGRSLSTDFVGTIPSKCNWINYQNDAAAGIDTTGTFGPAQLTTQLQGRAMSPSNSVQDLTFFRAFRTEDTLAYANETILLSDSAQASAFTSAPENVVAVHMVDYGYNFLSFETLTRDFDSNAFDFATNRKLYNLYQGLQPGVGSNMNQDPYLYEEKMRVIEFGQLDPMSFRINERDAQRSVGWSVRNGVNSNTSNVHFFDYQSGTLINPEAKQEYTWGNVVSPEVVSSARPGLCAGFATYARLDHRTGQSSVWLYNLETDTSHDLSSKSLGGFYPSLSSRTVAYDAESSPSSWSSSSSSSSSSPSSATTCTALWLEPSSFQHASLSADGYIDPTSSVNGTNSEWTRNATVRLLELPGHVTHSLNASQWSDGSFDRIYNVMPSADVVFFVLASSAGTYRLKYYNYATKVFATVGSADSPTPIKLASVSSNGALYWKGTKGQRRLMLARVQPHRPTSLFVTKGTPMPPQYELLQCEVTNAATAFGSFANISAAALFEDTVLYRSSNRMYRLDLNKDNDYLFDANDLFPLSGEFGWDADNDGIADEADIVPTSATAACLQPGAPRGACMHDLFILYIAWACFVFVSSAAGAGYVLSFQAQLEEVRDDIEMYADTYHLKSEDVDEDKYNDIVETLAMKAMYKLNLLADISDTILLVLTLVAVFLAFLPIYLLEEMPEDWYNLVVWTDMYITWLFGLDLVLRMILRSRKMSISDFMGKYYYEFLALMLDIPGVTFGRTEKMVSFIFLNKTVRVLRLLKSFRVARLYQKLAQQNFVVTMMVTRPVNFIFVLFILLVCSAAIVIKIFEQHEQPDPFADYANCLWFTLVTVTTVGYGDFAPKTWAGQTFTVMLLFMGIGFIGIISGQIAKTIQTVGKEEEKIRQVQIDYGRRRAALQPELSRFRLLFNPVLIASSSIFALEPATTKKKTFRNLKMRVRRGSVSNLNVKGIKDAVAASTENHDDHARRRSMALGRKSSQLYCPFEINQMTRLLSAGRKEELFTYGSGEIPKYINDLIDSVKKEADDWMKGIYLKQALIFIVLKTFLPNHWGRGEDATIKFNRFFKALCSICFRPVRQNHLFIERIFTLENYLTRQDNQNTIKRLVSTQDDNHSWWGEFDIMDPLDGQMKAVEDLFRSEGVLSNVFADQVQSDIMCIMLEWDRVQSALWALENLTYRKRVDPKEYVHRCYGLKTRVSSHSYFSITCRRRLHQNRNRAFRSRMGAKIGKDLQRYHSTNSKEASMLRYGILNRNDSEPSTDVIRQLKRQLLEERRSPTPGSGDGVDKKEDEARSAPESKASDMSAISIRAFSPISSKGRKASMKADLKLVAEADNESSVASFRSVASPVSSQRRKSSAGAELDTVPEADDEPSATSFKSVATTESDRRDKEADEKEQGVKEEGDKNDGASAESEGQEDDGTANGNDEDGDAADARQIELTERRNTRGNIELSF